MERAFFPLDEELGLLPGTLTPSLQEDLVRLGTWVPFGKAARELAYFRGTEVGRTTAQRVTEAAGAAYVAWQEAEGERIQRDLPSPPGGAGKLFVSADGAMVPLVGGEWAEVKTLVIGEVRPPVLVKGEWVVRTQAHSYFSRLTDADTFQQQALVEIERRGVEKAEAVVAISDGAEWIQKFFDQHCPEAVRILDFPHAGEHLGALAQGVWGADSASAQAWLTRQLHDLKHLGPAGVLTNVRELVAQHPEQPELPGHLAYLEKRVAHMQYPTLQAAGWPIGDGAVESGNKLVVEARLKGSGMHWARAHVNPMLALRNLVCSDRWQEDWPHIAATLRLQERQHRNERRQRRREAAIPPPPILPPSPAVAAPKGTRSQRHPPDQPATPQKPRQPWRPPPDHPWRRMPIGRTRRRQQSILPDAKT